MTNNQTHSNKTNKKTTSKQIVAIAGVVLLIAMYLFTLISAIFDKTNTMHLFRASLIATFTIPLLIWVYIWMYGKLTQKHTIADFDLEGNDFTKEKE